MDALKQPYQYANRNEVELTLLIKEGVLPTDIYGVVYLTSMCGSLNSEGLPIPQKHPGDSSTNPEYGTPLLAGDGMIFKIDFNSPKEVRLKTCISKPPCYYADLATDRKNNPTIDPKFKNYGFKSAGLTRASMQLGFRNELSVAVIPIQFEEDKHPRMIATFDAGRPWEFNTENLELITPIEKYSEWIKGTPAGLKFPFYLIQTSAHPSFDALTKEFYTVNYIQKKGIGYQVAFFLLLLEHRDQVKQHLEEKANLFERIRHSIEGSGILKEIVKDVKQFFDKSHEDESFKDLLKSVLHKHAISAEDLESKMKTDDSPNEVYLMKWNGKQEILKKWKVVDENGESLIIDECMHQTALTEDYILLSDASFKFSADLLINNPFPEVPAIDRMLRLLLNKKSPVDMALYLVKRSDLKDSVTVVKAKKFSLPEDCIHFVANYKNPDGNITLYTINNNSVCVAEWVRPYDTLKIGGTPVYPDLVGLPAMSAMDLNSLTKYVVNLTTGITSRQDCIETGGPVGKVNQPHTWEVCLLTYRDMIAPNKVVDEIKNLFVFSAGLNSQKLTTFMYDLFKDVPNKVIPTEEVLKYTESGVTQSLFRLNTDGMKIQDSYMTEFNVEIRSLQFIPRRSERKGVEYSMNGYILCIMMIGESKIPNAPSTMKYEREIWIFEADNLAKGPVCKLYHPEMSYAFTLHSAWIEEAQAQESGYHIDILEDFKNPQSILPGVQANIKEFFEKYIYPHFEKKA
jgi:carotenoid cleavage dioxygenase-like enzyme